MESLSLKIFVGIIIEFGDEVLCPDNNNYCLFQSAKSYKSATIFISHKYTHCDSITSLLIATCSRRYFMKDRMNQSVLISLS